MICFNSMLTGSYLSLMPERLTSLVQQQYGLRRLPVDADFGRRDIYLWHRRDCAFRDVVESIRATIMQVVKGG